MGDHPEHLVALVGGDQRACMVIANAMDDAPPDVRRASVELELAALADLGLGGAELDLRDYFAHQQRLRQDLAGPAWPGCAAATRSCSAMPFYRSGADTVFRELLAANALVYAGYSAIRDHQRQKRLSNPVTLMHEYAGGTTAHRCYSPGL